MAELFTLDEAAAIAEIEPDTVRTALEKRAVTPSRKVKTGKAVRYRFSESAKPWKRTCPPIVGAKNESPRLRTSSAGSPSSTARASRWSMSPPCFARTFRRKRSRRTFPPSTRRTYNTPGWPLDSVLHQGDRKGDCESKESTVTAVDSVIAGRTHFAGIGAQTG